MIDLREMTVLVVDDMKSMRLTIIKMLRNLNLGRRVLVASDGREALSVLKKQHVDLILMDWQMPKIKGSQVLDLIRKSKRLRYLPVIMISAEAERDIVSEVAEIQVDGYLLKPLSLDMLEKKIKEVVHRANYPDEATLNFRKATEYETEGSYTEAIELMGNALRLKPQASRLLRAMGMLYMKNGQSEKAVDFYKKAIAVNDQDATTLHLLSEYYFSKGELSKSAHYQILLLQLTTKYLEETISLGKTLLEQGKPDPALRLFSMGISKAPRNLRLKERIINICMENDTYEYALDLLETVVAEFPKKHHPTFKAGLVCMKLGDDEKALDYFISVEKQQGNLVSPKLEIAKIYINRQQIYNADQYLTKILRKDPENEEALSLRRAL